MVDQRSDNTLLIRERARELASSGVDWDGEITAVTDVEPLPPARAPQDSAASIDPEKLHPLVKNALGILGAIPPGHRVLALLILILAGAAWIAFAPG